MGVSSALGSAALAPSGFGFRNLLINGAMQIDQRGSATTAVTTNAYVTDRWYVEDGCDAVLSSQQSTDVPTGQGFRNSLKITATTADASIGSTQFSVITQWVEGTNSALLAWGSSGAKQVTVSFWVKASVAGTYSLTLYNDGASRICPTAYTINAANTWEKKVVNVVGDTSGTWLTTTGRGVSVNFYTALGSTYLGTSGAWNGSSVYGVTGQANAWASTNNIFAITGVQLEANPVATNFEQRPIGVELALCQRYYEKSYDTATAPGTVTEVGVHWHSGSGNGSGRHYVPIRFKVEKRTNGYTVATYDPAASSTTWRTNNAGQTGLQRTPSIEQKGTSGFVANVEDGGYSWVVGNTRGHWAVSDEL
jgi:hypothetical protein